MENNNPNIPENETVTQSAPQAAPRTEPVQFGNPVPPAKEKKNRTWLKLLLIILACALVIGGLVWAGREAYARLFEGDDPVIGEAGSRIASVFRKDRDEAEEGEEPEEAEEAEEGSEPDVTLNVGIREDSAIGINEIDTGKLLTAAEVYAKNVNSTVGITVGITYNYWGYTSTAAASGSGFIISDNGYILTNYHVIEDANSITVTTYDDTSYDAEVVGYDQNNDIAVIKVEAEGLAPVIIGDSDKMNVGDTVIAIGNPLGELTFSLTQGGVSALGREVTLSDGVMMNLIQTDCAINSGNSGGALFNLYGEVIGITNAKYSSTGGGNASIDNIGFAIPMNSIMNIVENILENGCYVKPYIGVSITSVDASSQAYGVPAGIAIAEVFEDSPAEKAGMLANDIVVEIEGKKATTTDELQKAVTSCKPGDELKLKVYRQGEYIDITVIVGEQIQSAETAAEQSENKPEEDNSGYGYDFGFGNGNDNGFGFDFGFGNGDGDDSGSGLDDWFNFFW